MYPILIAAALLAADAPPEREKALRAAVTTFADAFQEGKLRKAYPLVDEGSQEAFLDMAKLKFSKYEWTKIEWSDDFTSAKVILMVDTEWKMPQATVPVRRPWDLAWKWKDGEWLWIWETPSAVATPFGKVSVSPSDPAARPDVKEALSKAPKVEDLNRAITVTSELAFSRANPREAEIQVTNGLPGHVDLTVVIPRIPGMKIDRVKNSVGPTQTIAFRLYWNPIPDQLPKETVTGMIVCEPIGGTHTFALNFKD